MGTVFQLFIFDSIPLITPAVHVGRLQSVRAPERAAAVAL